MRRITTALFFVMLACVLVTPAHAQTQADIKAALERMDAILAEMQALRAEFASLASNVATTPSPSVLGVTTSGLGFTEPLEYGETNDDIAYIQSLLATDPEIYPYGVASGFFGPKTQEAIRNFQTKMGLDPVGVVGPSTRAILETFKAAYPTGAFPDNVLSLVPTAGGSTATPTVAGVSTTVTPTPLVSTNPILSIDAEIDRGEAEVTLRYRDGERLNFIVSGDTERAIAQAIARRTGDDLNDVLAVLELDEDGDSEYDDDDAEDAIDDADEAIDDAKDAIRKAEDDDEDVDEAEDLYDEAKDLLDDAEEAYDDEDWDRAVSKANKAEEKAKDAEDEIGSSSSNRKGDSDEIDRITAEVEDEDETVVTVEYDDGSEYEFEVEEDKKDDIISEIADELDMDEDDVEDVIRFKYGDIDQIDVLADEEEDEARVTVEYESGVSFTFIIDFDDDEDEMLEDIADELDEDVDDIEDVTDFDYK